MNDDAALQIRTATFFLKRLRAIGSDSADCAVTVATHPV
jgi:hypothetical protein